MEGYIRRITKASTKVEFEIVHASKGSKFPGKGGIVATGQVRTIFDQDPSVGRLGKASRARFGQAGVDILKVERDRPLTVAVVVHGSELMDVEVRVGESALEQGE